MLPTVALAEGSR